MEKQIKELEKRNTKLEEQNRELHEEHDIFEGKFDDVMKLKDDHQEVIEKLKTELKDAQDQIQKKNETIAT